MKIGLYDVDNTNFGNYALMKISTYHKNLGDDVSFYLPIMHNTYNKIYASSVFTCSDKTYVTDGMIKGGTGFKDFDTILPKEIDDCLPDLDLYNLDYALGFLTRGCIRKCEFCFVPKKEGKIKPYSNLLDIMQDKKKAVLMDNNVLASDHGLNQIEIAVKHKIKLDFNQGLDARIISKNKDIAKLLSKVKWLKPLRMACDSEEMLEPILKATELLRGYNCTPKNYFIYHVIKDIREKQEEITEIQFSGFDHINLVSESYLTIKDAEGIDESETSINYEDIDNLIKALQKVKQIKGMK